MKTELKVKLISHTPDPERLIAAAAKLCYSESDAASIFEDLTPEAVERFLRRLTDMGHASPVEHANFTFSVEGVSRSLTHQLVRHRHASYSQKSQRYVTEGGFDYIVPPEIEKISEAKDRFIAAMDCAEHYYHNLVKDLMDDGRTEKEAYEDARYVLPNACETKIVVTMNVRELLHFFNVRCCNRAQWEIRELATEMLRQCIEVAPILFKNAGPNCVSGPCPEGKMTCGKCEEMRRKFDGICNKRDHE